MNIKKTAVITAIAGVVLGASFAAAQVTTTSSCYQFERNLRVGNTGADVKALQQTLNANGFTVAAAGHAGSAGMETSYFGNATKNALIKWQEANAASTLAPWGLTSGTGFFGATSRAEMNKCAPGTPTTPGIPPVSGAVSVSLASVQPNTVLVQNSAHAKLADFVFSGTGIVTGVKLQRTGVSNNTALTNVYLYDGNVRISDAASVLSDGTINFNYGTGLFSVTGTKVISVYADIADNTSGQSVGVSLIGYTTSGNVPAVVAGVNGPNLPIAGATIVTATLATTSAQTQVDVGSQNVDLWSATANISRDAYLSGGSFKVIGSAPYSAFANAKLFVDGVQVGNAVTVDSMGRITFAGSTFLRAGAHTISVRADIVDGAGRDYYVSLEQGSDLLFEDAQLRGAYAIPTLTGNVAIYNLRMPVTNAQITACSSANGCAILNPDANFSGMTVSSGSSNQVIGKFILSTYGEPVKLMSANVDVIGASTTEVMSNISVYVGGVQVSSGGTNVLADDAGVYLSNLGGIIVNPGTPVVIEVRGDMRTPAGANLSAQNVRVELSNLQVQGQQSRSTQTLAGKLSNIVSVGSLVANFTNNAAFTGSKVASTQYGVKIGSFIMSTGASEGVRLTQVDVTLTPGNYLDLSNVTNLILKDGATVIGQRGTIGSGTTTPATATFSTYMEVPANSSKTFDLYADITNAPNAGTLSVTGKGYYQGMVGLTTETASTLSAQLTTVAQPTIGNLALVTSQSKAPQYVVGGTVNNLATFSLTAAGSDFTLNKVQMIASNPAIVAGVTIDGVTATNLGNGRFEATLSRNVSTVGTNLPVNVTFVSADMNNNLQDATTTIGISYIEGNAGGLVTLGTRDQYTAIAASATTTSTSSTMTLLGAMPSSVKIVPNSASYAPGTLSDVRLGTLSVTATGGTMDFTQFTVSTSSAITSLKLVNAGTNTEVAGSVCNATTGICTVNTGNFSGTVQYDILGSGVNNGTVSTVYSVRLGASADFKWDDITGGDTPNSGARTGALVAGYNN